MSGFGQIFIDQWEPAPAWPYAGIAANYSALPDPTLHDQEIYLVTSSQGTAWLPWSLGGTYYAKWYYWSNVWAWTYVWESPYQATQWDVNTGIINDQFVTPFTLNGYSRWATKLDANTPITGATKTKITYDVDWLVTAWADATSADIADSLNKRYVTDANLTTIWNQSGVNTGDQTSIVGISGTKAQFNTAVTDGNFMYIGDAPTAHTHISTEITDFNSASRAQTEAELVAGTNITITPSGSGATRQLTIASTGGGGGWSPFATDILVNGLTVGRWPSDDAGSTSLGIDALAVNVSWVNNTVVWANGFATNEWSGNTWVGANVWQGLSTGVNNTFIGDAITVGNWGISNSIGIGKGVLVDQDNLVVIGDSSITETRLYGLVETPGGVTHLAVAGWVVEVAWSAPPNVGDVLTAIAVDTAVWAAPAGGGVTEQQVKTIARRYSIIF